MRQLFQRVTIYHKKGKEIFNSVAIVLIVEMPEIIKQITEIRKEEHPEVANACLTKIMF